MLREKRSPSRRRRRGAACVELAIALPILMILTFASIEAANAIYLKQVLTQAAYEAARVATANGGTEAAARSRAEQYLSTRNIRNAQISFSTPINTNLAPGTNVETTVAAAVRDNAIGRDWYFGGVRFSVRVVMTRI